MKHHILVIDDDKLIRDSMRDFLADEGFIPRTVPFGDEAVALIKQNIIPFSMGLVDIHLKDELGNYESGKDVIAKIMSINPKFKIIGFSGDGAEQVSLDSYQSGAINFVRKGTSQTVLLAMIHRLCKEYEIEHKPLTIKSRSEFQDMIEKAGMIGQSKAAGEIAELMLKAAATKSNVLIRGEPGTGKELIANGIHNNSKRSSFKFIPVNAGAIAEGLTESELFGHDKGSFTGASQNKVGKFQAADRGTLFFDEIGEMSYDLQKVLLRALQERKITPVGSNVETSVDVRIIAATNAPLEDMIEKKTFRADLFDRLNVIQIFAPPLRDRLEDIPLLVEHFMKKFNQSTGLNKIMLDAVVDKIQRNPPSGNIRGLQNLVERLHTLSDTSEIDLRVLDQVTAYSPKKDSESKPQEGSIRKHIEQIRIDSEDQEKKSILYALELKKKTSAAADFLDVTREYLRSRMRALKIEFISESSKKQEV